MVWRGHQSDSRRDGLSVPLLLYGLGPIGLGFWPGRGSWCAVGPGSSTSVCRRARSDDAGCRRISRLPVRSKTTKAGPAHTEKRR